MRRSLIRFTACALALLGLLVGPALPQRALPDAAAGPAASAVATPATVTVDLAKSRGAFPFTPGGQVGATPQSWRYGASTLASLQALRPQHTRVWLKFSQAVDVKTRVTDYPRWYDYLDTYHSRSQRLLVNWQSNYDPLVTGGTWSAADLLAAERDMLAHYKQRFPKIEYIEVENEDLVDKAGLPAYYAKYRFMYQVVNAVNALRLGGPALKVGGPTLDIYSELRLGLFLDAYKADPSPAKRLDFVSYHQYLINTAPGQDWTATKDNPAVVATERARVDAMLRARVLPVVPVMVTEIGIFPRDRESALGFDPDLHIQAAAAASLHYHYAGQNGIVPFDWTIDHPENDRKDFFVSTDTGEARPYYNVLRMESLLPATRYQANSDALTARGTGVYGVAAADARTVAAMTWNYQWTAPTSFDARVVFTNLPAAFRTSNVRVTRYRIAGDTHAGPLSVAQTFVIGPRTAGTYYGQTLPLGPNELRLTTLSLTTDPVD